MMFIMQMANAGAGNDEEIEQVSQQEVSLNNFFFKPSRLTFDGLNFISNVVLQIELCL